MFGNIGKRLSAARKDSGFSVSYISELTGYSVRSIYRYENNIIMPNVEYLMYLSKICSVSTDKLLGLDN